MTCQEILLGLLPTHHYLKFINYYLYKFPGSYMYIFMKSFFLTNNHKALHHLLPLLICILFLIFHMKAYFLYLYLYLSLHLYLLTRCHLRLHNLLNLCSIPLTLPFHKENLKEPSNLLLTSKIIIVPWLRLLLHHSPLRSGIPSLTFFLVIFSSLLTNSFV